MLRKITETVFSRGMIAILTFIIVMINARVFGSEGVGTISLIMLAIAINQLFCGLIGAGSLVYFASRENNVLLFFFSAGWDILACTVSSFIMYFCSLIPEGYFLDVLSLSLLLAFITTNQMILMGHEKIRQYNILTLVQTIITFVILLICLFGFRMQHIRSYFMALYVAYIIAFFWSLYWILPYLKKKDFSTFKPLFYSLLSFGVYSQSANFFQLLNYRICYYFIDFYMGRSALGIFDIATKLSEGLWIVGKSIASVGYATTSNSGKERAAELALKFMKVTFTCTIVFLMVLLFIPENIYLWIFGQTFAGVKKVIYSMAPGILTLACSMMLSQYFSGVKKVYINTIGSGIGLCVMSLFVFFVLPYAAEKGITTGLLAAGLATSFTYTASFLYQSIKFKHLTGFKIHDYIPSLKDFSVLKKMF